MTRRLIDWFKCNKLKLNPDKTVHMIYSHDSKIPNLPLLALNDTIIETVEINKFLGLWIGHRLNWKTHCDELCNKLRSCLYSLNSLKHVLPESIKLQLYYSMFYSHIIYGLNIWGTTINQEQLSKLQALQNKAKNAICL